MRVIDTYEELRVVTRVWRASLTPRLLVVMGPGGRGKTMAFRLLPPHPTSPRHMQVLSAKATARGIFDAVARWPNADLLLDDVPVLGASHRAEMSVLKALADTTSARSLTWTARGRTEYVRPTGGVAVVSNWTPARIHGDYDVEAVLDRADVVYFDPPKPEMMCYLRTYARDAAVLALLDAMPRMPSLRVYEHALAYRHAAKTGACAPDYWQRYLVSQCVP